MAKSVCYPYCHYPNSVDGCLCGPFYFVRLHFSYGRDVLRFDVSRMVSVFFFVVSPLNENS